MSAKLVIVLVTVTLVSCGKAKKKISEWTGTDPGCECSDQVGSEQVNSLGLGEKGDPFLPEGFQVFGVAHGSEASLPSCNLSRSG